MCYINRIDIPLKVPGEVMQLEDYFVFYLETPSIPGFQDMTGFAINSEFLAKRQAGQGRHQPRADA